MPWRGIVSHFAFLETFANENVRVAVVRVEIVDLIDREADMLNRGRTETSLEGLRKRLSNLFLQFIETPEFNPEAARF